MCLPPCHAFPIFRNSSVYLSLAYVAKVKLKRSISFTLHHTKLCSALIRHDLRRPSPLLLDIS
jgi:hypothetical protein